MDIALLLNQCHGTAYLPGVAEKVALSLKNVTVIQPESTQTNKNNKTSAAAASMFASLLYALDETQ